MNRIIKIANTHIANNRFLDSSSLDEDPEVIQYFKTKVAELKKEAIDASGRKVAPKANGFLYFTCIMMHAAEAALINEDGSLKKTATGEDVQANWEKRSDGSWVWHCNDVSIMPMRNANRDIFPAAELKIAYKKWIGKPLCLDHKSSSVDYIRGVIVDTVWDDKRQRIIALCALDKENYPDLARKVASGYSADVSMGTAVSSAICTETGCHRVARVESDFCDHMRAKSCYGEINVGLSPIELSIVVNGADPGAKIRRVIAAADKVAAYDDKQKLDEAGITTDAAIVEAEQIKKELQQLANNETLEEDPYAQRGVGPEMKDISGEQVPEGNVPQAANTARYASELNILKEKIEKLDLFINKMASVKESNNKTKKDTVMTNQKNAYFQGGGGVNEPAPGQVKYPKEEADSIRNTQDKQMLGTSEEGSDGLWGDDEAKKKELLRAASEAEARSLRRQAALEKAHQQIQKKREAYFNGGGGVNEPTPGKTKYPNETDAEKIRDKEDKQMVGAPPFPNVGKIDGLYGDDEKTKKLINRAKLNAKFVKASNEDGSDNLSDSQWQVYAKGDDGKSRLVFSATVGELTGPERVASLYSSIATKDYGLKMIDVIRSEGVNTAKAIFKGAQSPSEHPFDGGAFNVGRHSDAGESGGAGQFNPNRAATGVREKLREAGLTTLTNLHYKVEVASTSGKWGNVISFMKSTPEEAIRKELSVARTRLMPNEMQEVLAVVNAARQAVDLGPINATASVKTAQYSSSDFIVKMPNGQGRPLTMEEWGELGAQGYGTPYEIEGVGTVVPASAGVLTNASVKKAQAPAPALPGPGETPDANPMAAAPADAMSPDGDFEPAGETGSPADQVKDKVRELGNLSADLEKAVEALDEEEVAGELDVPEAPVAVASTTLGSMRKTLSYGLRKGIKQALAEVSDMVDELKLIEKVNSDGTASSARMTVELLSDASSDIEKAKQAGYKMMSSFVRYAKAVDNIKKTAQEIPDVIDRKPQRLPTGTLPVGSTGSNALEQGSGKAPAVAPPVAPDAGQRITPRPTAGQRASDSNDLDELMNMLDESCAECGDSNDLKAQVNEDGSVDVEGTPTEVAETLKTKASTKRIANMTREERDVLRTKLAQKGTQFSDMLSKAHPQGGFTTELDTKPTGDLAKVEDLEEIHDKAMEVATKAPSKVREAAEKIQKLVIAGTIDPKTDFPGLIAEGLDAAAVSYWKKFWGEAKDPEASRWVSELVKGTTEKKAAANEEALKIKVARAYELAYDMASRGLVARDPSSLRKQVEKIMTYSEDNFSHLQETIGRIPTKTASLPEVGITESVALSTDYIAPRGNDDELKNMFDQAFAGRKY